MDGVDLISIDRADGVFHVEEMDYRNFYFSGCLNCSPFCYVHIQTHPSFDFAQIHLQMVKWSLSTAKSLRWGFDNRVKPFIRQLGYNKIRGIKIGGISEWSFLMEFLGFEPYDGPDGSKLIYMEI